MTLSTKEQYRTKRTQAKERAKKIETDQLAKAEALLAVINDSARHVRNFYITFISLAVYISMIVWSTTDEMLLRISPVTLPLLNLQIPIKGFYTIVPYLFLLVHFNLLLQLHLLVNKLTQFNQQLNTLQTDDAEHLRIRLFPFPFVQMLSAKHKSKGTQGLLIVMVWLLIIIMPPVVLILLQLGFLPFHDSEILCGQRIAVTLDLLCLLLFFPMIYKHGTKRWLCYGQSVLLSQIASQNYAL